MHCAVLSSQLCDCALLTIVVLFWVCVCFGVDVLMVYLNDVQFFCHFIFWVCAAQFSFVFTFV